MNSRNTNRQPDEKVEAVRIVAEKGDVRVIRSGLVGPQTLAISDDNDRGKDPYNSTGQHVILKTKSVSKD